MKRLEWQDITDYEKDTWEHLTEVFVVPTQLQLARNLAKSSSCLDIATSTEATNVEALGSCH